MSGDDIPSEAHVFVLSLRFILLVVLLLVLFPDRRLT
jgi:hypothetical protein